MSVTKRRQEDATAEQTYLVEGQHLTDELSSILHRDAHLVVDLSRL